MSLSASTVRGIERQLRRAEKLTFRDRGLVGVSINQIARRFRVAPNTVMSIKRGAGLPTFTYKIARVPVEERARLGVGRDPYCPCGRAFEFATDTVIGRVTEFCPRGCSSQLLSRDGAA